MGATRTTYGNVWVRAPGEITSRLQPSHHPTAGIDASLRERSCLQSNGLKDSSPLG